jgi:hypothetical protein
MQRTRPGPISANKNVVCLNVPVPESAFPNMEIHVTIPLNTPASGRMEKASLCPRIRVNSWLKREGCPILRVLCEGWVACRGQDPIPFQANKNAVCLNVSVPEGAFSDHGLLTIPAWRCNRLAVYTHSETLMLTWSTIFSVKVLMILLYPCRIKPYPYGLAVFSAVNLEEEL